MARCLLCPAHTYHQLTGEASVGNRRAAYRMHICPGCWWLFERFRTGAQAIEAEIVRQVEASWPTA